MKKVIFSLAIFFMATATFGQNVPIQKNTKELYLHKSKTQKTVAWSLLGGETFMVVIGAANFDSSWDSGTATETDIWGFVMLTGIVADLVSIPFFISSSKNKKIASFITLSNQPVLPESDHFQRIKTQPMLTLNITF